MIEDDLVLFCELFFLIYIVKKGHSFERGTRAENWLK